MVSLARGLLSRAQAAISQRSLEMQNRTLAADGYFPYPYSLRPLPNDIKYGLIPIGICASLSVLTTFGLLSWITYRMISWRSHYKAYVGYNQYVVLIYNLLLADLAQSLAFIISFHWLGQDSILAPTTACSAQGFLIHIGDVSSGFFVLAIAVHTWYSVVRGRKISYTVFLISVISCWVFSLILTIIGPVTRGREFYTRAGAWCWASEKYESDRLWLHYLWIFIDEFGTIIIYSIVFVYLRNQLSSIIHDRTRKNAHQVSRATWYMVVYPLIYVVCTLPLAAGRMATMTGNEPGNIYYCIAGTLMTSCGFLDTLLYTFTRRVLVSNELSGRRTKSHSRGGYGRNRNTWEISSFDRPGGNSANHNHTVTITGGGDDIVESGSRGATYDRGRGADRRWHGRNPPRHRVSSPSSLREPSPSGSTDSMIKRAGVGLGEVKAETKVEITIQPATDSYSESSVKDDSLKATGNVSWKA